MNPVPLYAGFNQFADRTQPLTATNQSARLPAALSRTFYPGVGDINLAVFTANPVTTGCKRRFATECRTD